MKIGIFDPYLDDLGGGEKYMMTIAECLSEKHDVEIFWNNREDLDLLIERFSLDLTRIRMVDNIFDQNTTLFKRLLESRKYDVIILLSDGSIPLLLSKRLYVHIQQPLEKFEKGSIKNFFKLKRVTKFFCNSFYTKSFISNRFGLKTTVIYPPVETKPKNIEKKNIILHVGRFRVKNVGIDDYKKQQMMIDAFKEIVDKGLKNWEFDIATSVKEEDIEEFERVKKTAVNYPIKFYVNKKNDELWDLYSKAKIYWHASGFGENLVLHPEFAEHFGISTVEAMSAGDVPVVINAGGQKEIVEEGVDGMLWDTNRELQDKTMHLIGQPKLLKTLSDNAKKVGERYSKDLFYQKLQELII